MTSFNVVTYNTKGLQNKIKRNKVFNYIHDKIHDNGIVFLQETHSTAECEAKWKKEWGGHIHFSHGTSNSTGTAICFSKNLNFSIVKSSIDTHGRIVILDIILNDEKFVLINLYNNNTEPDQLKTLDLLDTLLSNHDVDGECFPILGGDFNLICSVQ